MPKDIKDVQRAELESELMELEENSGSSPTTNVVTESTGSASGVQGTPPPTQDTARSFLDGITDKFDFGLLDKGRTTQATDYALMEGPEEVKAYLYDVIRTTIDKINKSVESAQQKADMFAKGLGALAEPEIEEVTPTVQTPVNQGRIPPTSEEPLVITNNGIEEYTIANATREFEQAFGYTPTKDQIMEMFENNPELHAIIRKRTQ